MGLFDYVSVEHIDEMASAGLPDDTEWQTYDLACSLDRYFVWSDRRVTKLARRYEDAPPPEQPLPLYGYINLYGRSSSVDRSEWVLHIRDGRVIEAFPAWKPPNVNEFVVRLCELLTETRHDA